MPPAPRGARISYGPRRLPGSRRIEGTRAILPRSGGTDRSRTPPCRGAAAVADEAMQHAEGLPRALRVHEQVVLEVRTLRDDRDAGLRESHRGGSHVADD